MLTALSITVLIWHMCLSASPQVEATYEDHLNCIAAANASTSKAAIKAHEDPLRPVYHLIAEANWLNDVSGSIFYNGAYHLSYGVTFNSEKEGKKSWSHAVSKDLVHWERTGVSLTFLSKGADASSVYSGCVVIHEGVPTAVYTRAGVHETQCIARSYDNMKTWQREPNNPVLSGCEIPESPWWHDPFVWKENDGWYMILGGGVPGPNGAAFLYRSKNLVQWETLEPLCIGDQGMCGWSCPELLPLGNKYLFVVSQCGDVRYSIGTYENHKFVAGSWHIMDLGLDAGFYGQRSLEDDKGRRIMWGWIPGGGTEGYPWNGLITLPRILTLRPDGRLGVEPAPELAVLRGKHHHFDNLALTPDGDNVLENVKGDCLEINVEFEPISAHSYGLDLRRSPDGKEKTTIEYDAVRKRLTSGDKGGGFELLENEKTLRLHIYLDKSVVEIYANGRETLTMRTLPKRSDSLGMSLFARGGTVNVKSLDIWEIKSIW